MRYRNQRGWILIDGLIATVIVAIALTTLAMVFRQSTTVSISATNYSQAVYLAQSTIENLKQYDLTAAVPMAELETTTIGIYTISLTQPVVTGIQYLAEQTLVPIRVTVTWQESGIDRAVVVTTYHIAALTSGELQ